MQKDSDSQTSVSLLHQLRETPADDDAWSRFVTRYGGKIHAWCRVWGLQEADAQDVTQNVLLKLSKILRNFEYKPTGKFRNWLRTVAYSAWCDFLAQRQKQDQGSGDSAVLRLLHSAEAKEDFLRHLEEECNRELLAIAVQLVKQRVQPHTWEAFRLMTYEHLSGEETATRLNMKPGTVYVAKNKVKQMLQEEMQRLDGDDSSNAAE